MSEYPHTERIKLRLNDFDPNAHVNNTAAVSFVQDARLAYCGELWGDAGDAASVAVVSLDVDFLAPIHMDDEVVVDVRVVDVGTSSWTLEYRLRAIDEDGDERVAVTATSVQVAWDTEAAGSKPLPEAWRSALEAAVVETAA